MTVKLTELPSFTDVALGVIVADGKPTSVMNIVDDVPTTCPVLEPTAILTANASIPSFSSRSFAIDLVTVPIPLDTINEPAVTLSEKSALSTLPIIL